MRSCRRAERPLPRRGGSLAGGSCGRLRRARPWLRPCPLAPLPRPRAAPVQEAGGGPWVTRRGGAPVRAGRLLRMDCAGAVGARACQRPQACWRGRSHAERAAGRRAGGGGAVQQGDRRQALRDGVHGRSAPLTRLREARDPLALATRPTARQLAGVIGRRARRPEGHPLTSVLRQASAAPRQAAARHLSRSLRMRISRTSGPIARVHSFSSSWVTLYPRCSHQGNDFHGVPSALRLVPAVIARFSCPLPNSSTDRTRLAPIPLPWSSSETLMVTSSSSSSLSSMVTKPAMCPSISATRTAAPPTTLVSFHADASVDASSKGEPMPPPNPMSSPGSVEVFLTHTSPGTSALVAARMWMLGAPDSVTLTLPLSGSP